MRAERGSVTLLAAASMSVTLLLGMLAVEATWLAAARLQAQTAAEAAALAAAPITFGSFGQVADPAAEAARFAGANEALLVSCRCPIDPVWRSRIVTVQVEVKVRAGLFGITTVAAEASAEFDPTVWLGG